MKKKRDKKRRNTFSHAPPEYPLERGLVPLLRDTAFGLQELRGLGVPCLTTSCFPQGYFSDEQIALAENSRIVKSGYSIGGVPVMTPVVMPAEGHPSKKYVRATGWGGGNGYILWAPPFVELVESFSVVLSGISEKTKFQRILLEYLSRNEDLAKATISVAALGSIQAAFGYAVENIPALRGLTLKVAKKHPGFFLRYVLNP